MTHSPALGVPDLADLSEQLWQSLAAVTFDKDDAASVRTALVSSRAVLTREVWDIRDRPSVAALCRNIWAEVLDALLAYRYRAGLSASECASLRAEVLWFLPLYTGNAQS